jgi:hypothetical protein
MSMIENVPKGQRIAGLVVSGLLTLFFLLDGVMKLVQPQQVVETTVRLGYQQSMIAGIGVTLLVSTLLYAFPPTSILGAILLTGYLGGAVATNVRAQVPVFNVLFTIVFGCLVWLGLWLRDRRLRSLLRVN